MTQSSTQKPKAVSEVAARKKFLLEGPIVSTLFHTSALAGVSLAFSFVMMVLHSTDSGMRAGVSSAVARAMGAMGAKDEVLAGALSYANITTAGKLKLKTPWRRSAIAPHIT